MGTLHQSLKVLLRLGSPGVFNSQTWSHCASGNQWQFRFSYPGTDSGVFCSWASALVILDFLYPPVISVFWGAVVCPVSSVLCWIWGELLIFSLSFFLLWEWEWWLPRSLHAKLRTRSHVYMNWKHAALCFIEDSHLNILIYYFQYLVHLGAGLEWLFSSSANALHFLDSLYVGHCLIISWILWMLNWDSELCYFYLISIISFVSAAGFHGWA